MEAREQPGGSGSLLPLHGSHYVGIELRLSSFAVGSFTQTTLLSKSWLMPIALLAGFLPPQVLVSLGNYLEYKRKEAGFTVWLEALWRKSPFQGERSENAGLKDSIASCRRVLGSLAWWPGVIQASMTSVSSQRLQVS